MRLQATALRAATLLAKRPGLFCRLMLAKLNTARPMPPLPTRRRVGGVEIEYDLNRYRGTAPMYFGSYAMLVVETMKRLLKPGDVFLDVGANIGYLSAVAAGLVGPRGQVHAFEPVPEYFQRLRRLAEHNPNHPITPVPCAAGESATARTIYVTREPGQSTLVPSYKNGAEIVSTFTVPVIRLDSYIKERAMERVALIKIDAEGFELPILKGLEGFFRRSRRLPAIVCEIAPRAYPLMGRTLAELKGFMASYGYDARDLIDGVTRVDVCSLDHVEDVLFLPAGG